MQYAAEVLVSFHWLKICSAYVDPKACAVGIVSSITPWTQIQTHCTAVWVWEHLWKQRKALSYPKLPSQAWIQTTPRSPMGLQGAQGGKVFSTGRLKETSLCFKEIIFTKDLKQKCSQGWNQGLRSYDLYTFRNPKQDRKDLCFQLQQSRWAWRHNNA